MCCICEKVKLSYIHSHSHSHSHSHGHGHSQILGHLYVYPSINTFIHFLNTSINQSIMYLFNQSK